MTRQIESRDGNSRSEVEHAMEPRFAKLEKMIDERFSKMEKLIAAKFESINSRLDAIEKRSVPQEQIAKIRTELRAVKERVSSIPT